MKLLVLDGNSILNRAFYGIRLLSTKEGIYTNAVYGFLTMFQKIKDETQPDLVAIAFDVKAPTFRHKAFDGYKAKRKGMPPELASQLPIIKEILLDLGYEIVECEGYEADDILGTLAKKCEDTNNECLIATGDKDSLQLISKNTSVRIAATKMGKPEATLYDEAKIMEVFHVTPKQLIDIKAIQGDTSDNIPGVPGIGQKGAMELITKYNNLDYIYENIDKLDIKEGMRKKLIEGKESAYMSRMLGEIKTDIPIDSDLKRFVPKEIKKDKLIKLMSKLEFFSLIEKMGLNVNSSAEQLEQGENPEFSVIKEFDYTEILNKIKQQGLFDFLCEFKNKVLHKVYFKINKNIFIANSENEGCLSFLKEILEDTSIGKRTHDLKLLYLALEKAGVNMQNVTFDTLLAAYILNPSSPEYSLSRLLKEYSIDIYNVTATDSPYEDIINQTAVFSELIECLDEKIKNNNQEKLLIDIELPLSEVLVKMESAGFCLDSRGIKLYGEMLEKKLNEITAEIYEYVGYEFNINSPKQLGSALFEKLMLPAKKKNKSGYSTNAEVLESLRYTHPVIELILEYRTLSKLKSTYCDSMIKLVASDGRIHSNFNQVETRTGRISSTDPNLQNIPVRTDVGKELRKFFCAKEGCVLVDADYSQIELRVLAHVSNDENMIEAFKNEYDIHAITASQVFNMPIEMVSPLMRSRAKAVNFGIVYGIGAFSLSKDIGVSRKEADNYIKSYLSHYSSVKEYMDDVVSAAKENGYAKTMFGRRRYLPELTSSNFNLRSFGERVAKNMPIQGTAADIIKIAMINVDKRLKREKLNSRLILQVHDELIVEAPEEEAKTVAKLLQDEMENAVKLKVPLVSEATIGKTWFDAKK